MKKFVCSLTPNPALDLGGVVKNLKPNEKSYVQDETRCPGGNAINVARVLTRLGIPVTATGFLGGGIGDEIKHLLDDEGVKNEFIAIKDHSRISVTVSNLSDSKQTRLSFPGPRIQQKEKSRLLKYVKDLQGISVLVMGGSFPKGFSSREINWLVRLARKRKIPVVVDCPAGVMQGVIAARPTLIKPNLEEFQALIGSKAKSIASVHREAQKLLDLVPFICVSSVEGGALLVTREQTYFGRVAKIKIRSTVGAGDSMVGAMVGQMHQGIFSGAELLRWGLAASAATLSHSGTAMGSAREIQRLYRKTKVERVK
jgi:1-phosphofructokinase family hexose kinase